MRRAEGRLLARSDGSAVSLCVKRSCVHMCVLVEKINFDLRVRVQLYLQLARLYDHRSLLVLKLSTTTFFQLCHLTGVC